MDGLRYKIVQHCREGTEDIMYFWLMDTTTNLILSTRANEKIEGSMMGWYDKYVSGGFNTETNLIRYIKKYCPLLDLNAKIVIKDFTLRGAL